jgi:hypothetical protein
MWNKGKGNTQENRKGTKSVFSTLLGIQRPHPVWACPMRRLASSTRCSVSTVHTMPMHSLDIPANERNFETYVSFFQCCCCCFKDPLIPFIYRMTPFAKHAALSTNPCAYLYWVYRVPAKTLKTTKTGRELFMSVSPTRPASNSGSLKRWSCPQCLIKHHATKMNVGVYAQTHAFLTSVLDIGEWPASRPGRFTVKKRICTTHRRAPQTAWTRWRREKTRPTVNRGPSCVSHRPAATLTELPRCGLTI